MLTAAVQAALALVVVACVAVVGIGTAAMCADDKPRGERR